MPIPKTRSELTELVSTSYAKLERELQLVGPAAAERRCVDSWSVKDLIAVRAWWTEQVVDWIEAGRQCKPVTLPATGYRWNETPRLNADVVAKSKSESYERICGRLERGVQRVLATIRSLNNRELLEAGTFEWAGKWPLSRWISLNTARQYATARTYIRRGLRQGMPGNS